MKKHQLLTAAISVALFTVAQTATPTDDKTHSVNFTQAIIQQLQSDAAALQQANQVFQNRLQVVTDNERNPQLDEAFAALIRQWKIVQTHYIAGELDSDSIDTPRLIDAYHNGKENLIEQLARLVKDGDDAQTALFKNTFKSITALEYFLYNDDDFNTTEQQYAAYTARVLDKHFQHIGDSYQSHADEFTADSDIAMSYLLNALIDSAYKLKEWRVGEPAGLSRKYKGEPDNRRQEYPYSQQSLSAIAAILAAHDQLMGDHETPNIGSTAIKQGAEKEIAHVRQLIADAQQQVAVLQKKERVDFSADEVNTLYRTLQQLNDTYYQSLVKALPIQAKILDADGD